MALKGEEILRDNILKMKKQNCLSRKEQESQLYQEHQLSVHKSSQARDQKKKTQHFQLIRRERIKSFN